MTSPPGPGNPYGEQYPNPQQGWQAPGGGGYGQYTPPPGPGPAGPGGPGGPGPWGYGQQPPPQPPQKSNTGLIIGLAAGAVVLLILIGVVGVVAANSGSGKASASPAAGGSTGSSPGGSASPAPADTTTAHTITLPSSAGGFSRTNGNVADRMTASLRSAFSKDPATAAIFQNAKIGLFTSGDKQVVFLGLSASDSPQLATELSSHPSSFEVDSMFTGAGIANANDYPTGPFGGTLRCGQGSSAGTPMAMCSWADSSTFGGIIGPNMAPASLAPVALSFRNAAER